ncbi:hypothetical protein [Spirillospora sp. NPDC047279]|uniref:hypothetical protein n=1 Tax=Spirillospora sp. NPDC047279 TaxID=3155478 RepID=UPI003402C0ED
MRRTRVVAGPVQAARAREQPTSLCLGARARKARGDAVDAFTRSFCGPEEAAAAGRVQ